MTATRKARVQTASVAKLTREGVLSDMKRRPGGAEAVALLRSLPKAERDNMLDLIAELRTRPAAVQRLAVAYVAGSLPRESTSSAPSVMKRGASSMGLKQRQAIRALYLNPRPEYPVADVLRAFPRLTREQVISDADGDLIVRDGEKYLPHELLMTFALVNWSGNPLGVLRALGADLPRVMSAEYKLEEAPVTVQLPRYIMRRVRAEAKRRRLTKEELIVGELIDAAAGLGALDFVDSRTPPKTILDPVPGDPWRRVRKS